MKYLSWNIYICKLQLLFVQSPIYDSILFNTVSNLVNGKLNSRVLLWIVYGYKMLPFMQLNKQDESLFLIFDSNWLSRLSQKE